MKIVELKGEDLVKDYSDEIERMLGSKMKSVKVRRRKLGPFAFTWCPAGGELFKSDFVFFLSPASG